MSLDKKPVIFVDANSIVSPVRFIYDLTSLESSIEMNIESDPSRCEGRTLVLTTVDEEMGEFLQSHKRPFFLLITPQEDFSGLDEKILARAARVVAIGKNPSLEVKLRGANVTRLEGAQWVREEKLPRAANPVPGDDDCEAVHIVLPHGYIDYWESFVATESVPRLVRVMTDRRNPPPAWFEEKVCTHGGTVETILHSPGALLGFFDRPGRYLRDNPTVDAIDLALLGVPRVIENIRCGRDLRRDIRPRAVVSWSSVLRDLLAEAGRVTEDTRSVVVEPSSSPPRLNVVCRNPTYLFADLVERFERHGCIHSEFPLHDADGYVWMRPQELVAFLDIVQEARPVDVPPSWTEGFERVRSAFTARDARRVERRSVAIHHGTCFEPIIQFDPYRLAKRLASVRAIAGVCEFGHCYGPARALANPHNYEFVPIGYDHKLFTEDVIRREDRKPGDTLRIGFVGRAYGTNEKQQLARSIYAHPKGYRKGGDHLINILLRLKARGLPFELHVVGKNWEEMIAECEELGLPVVYYARDENIQYVEYPRVFATFDALLISARGEGGPVAAVEAMSVGVPVVGSSVGIIPFLAETTDYCWCFEYDTKWHVMDHAKAAKALEDLANREFTHRDRLAVRESVAAFTTDAWVTRVCELAARSKVRSRPMA